VRPSGAAGRREPVLPVARRDSAARLRPLALGTQAGPLPAAWPGGVRACRLGPLNQRPIPATTQKPMLKLKPTDCLISSYKTRLALLHTIPTTR
jgi:hypothetical protein